ncbi:MAG: carboxylesterase family protein [Longimicrobiales bacterium]|jgi:dienelactone hydrolase
MVKRGWPLITAGMLLLPGTGAAQASSRGALAAPNQSCMPVTQANADASAGTANVQHDGTALPGIPFPDISQGFRGIPRSAQPPLTASQHRILECTYFLDEANAEMPYTLFIPSTYDPSTPTPLVVDLHGLNITPLMQILFDGTTDLAERHGFIVVAPMGYSVSGGWGGRAGNPVETARVKPGSEARYGSGELSEIDAMTVLAVIRDNFSIDDDRIYLTGHSMGGGGTYHLGGKYNNIWAGLAPLAGAGGIRDAETAERFRGLPMLIMHGEFDSIVSAAGSRRSVMWLQSVGAQYLYIEVPGVDHEFWIRRGAENMEKVFLFFDTVSKRTNIGFITENMIRSGGH